MWKITAMTTLVASKCLRLYIAAGGKAWSLWGSLRNLQTVFYRFQKQWLLAVYSYLPSLWRFLEGTENVHSFPLSSLPPASVPTGKWSDCKYAVTLLDGFGHWHWHWLNTVQLAFMTALINPELSLKALAHSLCAVANSVGQMLFSAVVPFTHTVFKKPCNDTRTLSCQPHM